MERFWVDYDKEADVLYISLTRPQQATDTIATDEGILFRYRGKMLVGMTILEASSRGDKITTIPASSKMTVTKKRKLSAKNEARG